MASSLKASTRGLEIVNRARKKKGWTKTMTVAWWETANTSQATLRRFWRGLAIQPDAFIGICKAIGISNWEEIVERITDEEAEEEILPKQPQDWGEAPDVSVFYGRTEELSQLEQWIVNDRCRLVALLGIEGIGKTALSVMLADQLQSEFDCLIWRSLRYAPSLEQLLGEVLQFLSNKEPAQLPNDTGAKISQLIDYLRMHRCLLILDEVETILRSGAIAGQYREGYEGYGELFRRIADQQHQSCLVLTSSEKPKDIASREGDTLPVRCLQLKGLKDAEACEIFTAKGLADPHHWEHLLQMYLEGHPLFLNIVSSAIKESFNGKVSEFLKYNTFFLGDIRGVLEIPFSRLSSLEKEIMGQLASNENLISLPTLKEKLSSAISMSELIEALESLSRRSLIEKHIESNTIFYTLQPVIMKYVKTQFY